MSHIHDGQTYLRRQVSTKQKQRLPNLSKHAETQMPIPSRAKTTAYTKRSAAKNCPLTDFVWPQLSRLRQRPRGETRTGTCCHAVLEGTTLWSTRGKAVSTQQWLRGSQRIVSHGNTPVARRRILFSRQNWKAAFSDTEALGILFIFAISKFLIRQQSSSERHGCSLLHQCCSYLIAAAHVVWWSEMFSELSRVVFSLKRKTVCLSKAFGSARSKTWLLDKVNWMFSPPHGDFESQEAKLTQQVASFSCKVFNPPFMFFLFFCVWQEENTGLYSFSMCRQFGGNIHVDDVVWNISSGTNSRSQKPPKSAPDRAGTLKPDTSWDTFDRPAPLPDRSNPST